MFRKHPEVAEAEIRLEELREQEQRAEPAKKADLVLLVDAQAKLLDELRWQHTPRPMVTQASIDAAKLPCEEVGNHLSERAYY